MKLWQLSFLLAIVSGSDGLLIPNNFRSFGIDAAKVHDLAIVARQADPPPPPPPPVVPSIHTDFLDLGHDFAEREILLQTDDGFSLTCIKCVMKGKFQVDIHSNADDTVLEDLSSSVAALVSSAGPAESTVASVVTSVAGSLGTVVGTAVESAASDVATAVTGGFGQLTSAVVPEITGIFDFPAIGFDRRLARRDIVQDLMTDITNNLSVSVHQIEPLHMEFNLEFASGNSSLELKFPFDNPAGLFIAPVLGGLVPSSFTLGPLKLALKMNIIGISLSAKLAPNINATIPIAADMGFKQDLSMGAFGIQDPLSDISVDAGDVLVSEFDPSLCLSAGIGPSLFLEVSEEVSQTKARLGVGFDIPKVSLCFQQSNNVSEQCEANGPIQNALEISSNVEVGIKPEFTLELGGQSVPTLPKIPDLSKNFTVLDKCFDIGSGLPDLTDGDPTASLTIPAPAFSTSLEPEQLGAQVTTQMNVYTNDMVSQPTQAAASVQVTDVTLNTEAAGATEPCVETVTVIVTATMAASPPKDDMATAMAMASSLPSGQSTTLFNEPIGVVFSTRIA